MLTKRQKETLDYIRAYSAQNGIAPSFIEMMDATGQSSKSGVYRILIALEERGFIRRLRDRARAIELIPDPHLDIKLPDLSDHDLARECRRRGYAMGKWEKVRERRGTGFIEVMQFREVAPEARRA